MGNKEIRLKKIAIMQPYIFPYIGYFQLINAVDEFVVYDDIEFTKKGWINRNRILVNGKDSYITLPLKNDSDYLTVKERYISDSWINEKYKMLNRINENYRKAPFFKIAYHVIEECILYGNNNLFEFIYNSLNIIKNHLGISTEFKISSNITYGRNTKSENKVIEICKSENAGTYINPIGASKIGLYNKENFEKHNIKLQYINSGKIQYPQFNNEFVAGLSIIDVIMFNSKETVIDMLQRYELV